MIVGALVEMGCDGVPPFQARVDVAEGGQSRAGPVDLSDGDGPVERDDRVVR